MGPLVLSATCCSQAISVIDHTAGSIVLVWLSKLNLGITFEVLEKCASAMDSVQTFFSIDALQQLRVRVLEVTLTLETGPAKEGIFP
ncbi:hypothetical protein MAE02_59770 [Microvirga aerophila]|uniref:Uncharacterized protein n=1 Tax=Microvirga aerophila TaxID=670291 RepID=A0A512C246_9HYPH|nr:hypothetical protein MAE02_59770 [Microvirga aerophila]